MNRKWIFFGCGGLLLLGLLFAGCSAMVAVLGAGERAGRVRSLRPPRTPPLRQSRSVRR